MAGKFLEQLKRRQEETMPKGNIHGRLERLEARAPTPASPPGRRQRVLEDLDRIAAWRRAGSPDNEEGRYVQALEEAIRRRIAEARGEGAE
jgi:hypothetical protein